MAFRFSLDTVLRLRENHEHAESLLLERRYKELAQIQGTLWEVEQNIAYARDRRNHELGRGTTAIELQWAIEEESRLRQHRDAIVQRLQEAQDILRQQIGTYRKARQKRDVLLELRKQKFDLHRHEQEKATQRRSDETFLLRRNRKR